MGTKGSKGTPAVDAVAAEAVDRLAPLGAVRSRKMFGGAGVFEGETMFALVTSAGELHFRVDDASRGDYEAAGAPQFHRMPYFRVPDEVRADDAELLRWGETALAAARAAKR